MDAVERMINRLEAGAATFNCSGYLNSIEPLLRTQLYTRFLFERLKRKELYITDLYKNDGQNWEQVFFILLFRFLGAPNNTAAFEKLAHIVTYSIVSRHLSDPLALEALLIGASGLLQNYRRDDYTDTLLRDFAYLSQKHHIASPMSAAEWNMSYTRPFNNPLLRLSQAIAILSQPDFSIDKVLECKSADDTARLFCHEASQYWTTHFIPASQSDDKVKRIGKSKADILAINAVAPLQFAYGNYIGSERMFDRALNLIDSIPAEQNSKITVWRNGGLIPRSALDTQSLIQLGDEYCRKIRCRECPVCKQITKTLKEACKLEENK